MNTRILCLLALLPLLAGCVTGGHYSDDAVVEAARYRSSEPPRMTLYTMINNRSGKGAHSSLLINASETVIFDPAGSFYADVVPEQDDVLFGISPQIEEAYKGAHARETFPVVRQHVPLTAEQAETAYRLALANGPVAGAFCANATARLVQQIPGFEGIRTTFYPVKLQEEFAKLEGVVTDKYYEYDSADLQEGLRKGNEALNAD